MIGKPHYPELIECDFCGRYTRGCIEASDPDSVKCSSCHLELTKVSNSIVVGGVYKTDDKPHSRQIIDYTQNELFK